MSCTAQEMYFRHLYAIQQPPLEARAESWANYTALFGVILHGNVNMQLPNGWLWDMIDEFVYQFQSFAQYRGKLSMKSAEEVRKIIAFADSHMTQAGGTTKRCHQCL
jgi:translation initiation factor 3 subunit L